MTVLIAAALGCLILAAVGGWSWCVALLLEGGRYKWAALALSPLALVLALLVGLRTLEVLG